MQFFYLGKTHIKKVFFLVVGPLRISPPYTNGLVVHLCFFCLVVRGVTPPHTLSGPTTKKTLFFMCVFPYTFLTFCILDLKRRKNTKYKEVLKFPIEIFWDIEARLKSELLYF